MNSEFEISRLSPTKFPRNSQFNMDSIDIENLERFMRSSSFMTEENGSKFNPKNILITNNDE